MYWIYSIFPPSKYQLYADEIEYDKNSEEFIQTDRPTLTVATYIVARVYTARFFNFNDENDVSEDYYHCRPILYESHNLLMSSSQWPKIELKRPNQISVSQSIFTFTRITFIPQL